MKSKKLISLLCAAAMTTSAFAGLVTTASAAATPVWSFDGSSTDGWSGSVSPTVATDEGSTDSYLDFLAGTGTKCNDVTFALPAAAQLSDDYVLEYDVNIHTSNGMGRLSQYTQLAFAGASPVQDTQVYNGAEYLEAAAAVNPDSEHSWNTSEEAGWGYAGDIVSSLTSRVELQGKMLINYDGTKAPSMEDGDAQIGDSKWVRVRNEVKDGKAKVTIADSNGTIVDGEEFAVSATKLTQIKMAFGRADTSYFIPTTPANIKLDNIKVYDGIAGTPAFSTADLRKSAVVATPVPAPEKVAGSAPKFYAPESAENPYTADFNGASVGTLGFVETTATEAKTVVNGMKVQLGNRDTGEDQKTYASIVKVANGDNAVRLSADKFSTNGRGPVVSLDNNIDLSDMTSGSAVMSFAVYLSKTDLNGIERLFLLDNTTNVDGNGCARDVVAVITTEDIQNEDETYKYTAGDSNIGIHVEPEAWHTITVVATAGDSPARIFVDGKYKDEDGRLAPALKVEQVGTGEGNKSYVTHLPLLAIENTKAYSDSDGSGGTGYSTALIDNVLTYYVQGDLEPKNLPQTEGEDPTPTPTPVPKHNATVEWDNTAKKATITAAADETEAFDGVLIHAAYDSNKVLTSVKTYDAKNITTDGIEVSIPDTDKVYTGDKLMLWNNIQDMVPYGMAVVEAGEAPVVKYGVTVAATENGTAKVDKVTAEAGEEITITATPAEGYELDTITVKDGDNGDVAVAEGKFTMPAKDVTVTVTFKEIYVAPATYTIAGTVDAGVHRVRLIDKADETNAIEATIADGKATATGVKAGTYTINVGYNGGYEADTITPATGEIEVTADNAEAFTVVSKASAKPAITGTVTITGTPAVGETLTATVEGINDGETPVYEWRAKAAGSEAFVAIEGATASTLALTSAMKGAQIKVIVKSEGTSGQLDSDPTAAVAGVKSVVTVAAATNGTVKVMNGETEVTEAVLEDTSLKVVATPDAGYAVKTITVAPTTEGSTTTVTVTDGAFTMPAEPVTVTVEFEYTGKVTIVPDATYVNVKNEETSAVNHIGDTPLLVGNAKLENGKIVTSNNQYDESSTALIFSIDASDYIGKIESAKLKFNATTQGGNNTYFRWWGKFANYIDFDAVGEAGITGANLETLGGTATQIHDEGNNQWTYGTTKNQTTPIEIDITDALKEITTGKVTMYLLVGTGRMTEVADLKVDIQASETAKEMATVNVHTVYADENGAIEVGANKYTEFGTAKSKTMYAGDKYIAGHTAVIDDNTKTTRYDYVSGDDEITAAAGTNEIYLVYTKTDYQTVTFTAKIGETVTAGVPIKINGTPTVVGTAMTETTITTADGTAEGSTAGVVTIKLLPGTYNYSVDATATYLAVDATNFTVANEALPVDVVLTANQKASATLKVVYTTDGTEEGKVGEATVYNEEANKFEDDVVSADDLASYRIVSKIANAEGLYGLYTYTSGGDQAVTLIGGENVVYITVTASEDTRLFNVYEDLEDGKSVFVNTDRGAVSVATDDTLSSKVQVFTGAGNTQNGFGFNKMTLPAITKPVVTIDLDYYNNERGTLTIGSATRATTKGNAAKNSYGDGAGAMFNIGITENNKNSRIQGDITGAQSAVLNKWMHVHVVINTTTKKVSYVITNKADNTEIASATDVNYVDTTVEGTVGQIDVFGYINNGTQKIDNVFITSADAE